jgi:hypothetical protein
MPGLECGSEQWKLQFSSQRGVIMDVINKLLNLPVNLQPLLWQAQQ